MSKSELWYQAGLRFECTQCGKCCSGAPGFVWVDDDEVLAMANEMNLDEEEFRRRFVRDVGERTSLVEYPDGDCIFLDPDSRTCLVYRSRPMQCRTWPFWDSNLHSKRTWAETCRACPGAGQGKLYDLTHIERQRNKSA